MLNYEGIAASKGYAIANAYKLVHPNLSFSTMKIGNPSKQVKRLNNAIKRAVNDLNKIEEVVITNMGSASSEIFKLQATFISSPNFINEVSRFIIDSKVNAETAVSEILERRISKLKNAGNGKFVLDKIKDIDDIRKRLLAYLLNKNMSDLALIQSPVIVVSEDLTPNDIIQLSNKNVKGVIADLGTNTSHSAILTKSLNIPSIFGLNNISKNVSNDDLIIVNGMSGEVIVNPSNELVKDYSIKITKYNQTEKPLDKLKKRNAFTKDGKKIEINANISSPKEVNLIKNYMIDGIGLYRTEYLYIDSYSLPTEDEQFNVYKNILSSMNNKPVVIRTLDIGGDKQVPYLDNNDSSERNPFLGNRSIRFSLSKTIIFRTQIRALLRASIYGNLSIMFPMISELNEWYKVKKIINEEKKKLDDEGIAYKNPKLGIMVEVPSVAIMADQFAKNVDFMSIGTNDLIQYVMAADRGNPTVAALDNPLNPALLRMLERVVNVANAYKIDISLCGEMACNRYALPILIGMGFKNLSMNINSTLDVKALLSLLDYSLMQKMAEEIIKNACTVNDVIKIEQRFIKI
ncbi:phosphoenolpyruvate--protein phosphotransferase [Apilactobacillus timberlakei]|uniref:phosphoenolpyruvate--protein phosphotransferase n=1 Tax=Apilactobacillus timberlakei TaxID=2008380 RepID=UPI0011292104|nr:phosphoenolpyruvate--protein phosphotransferase [Apilactobacillus timberlakei]TPR14568.1 phosphoenolpyruvate--protein phosphotransferase [Apilactobacillus timberlakei]